jgi:Lon protease-like protein
MGDGSVGDPSIALLPLSGLVHFPHTELALRGSEPAFRQMVEDILAGEESQHWIGIVLPKPGWDPSARPHPDVYPDGTAGRILDTEFQTDGQTEVLLHGEFRFELRSEVLDGPYRRAVVHPLDEPWLNERDAGIVAVRSGLLEALRSLAGDLGERFPLDQTQVEGLAAGCFFEELVNRIAAALDLSDRHKLQLLHETLPERGLSVLSILQERQSLLDLVRPFRHLSPGTQQN